MTRADRHGRTAIREDPSASAAGEGGDVRLIVLIRVGPAKGMDRWYCVSVGPGLLDEWAVVCAWGSRRTAYQRLRVLPAGSPGALPYFKTAFNAV